MATDVERKAQQASDSRGLEWLARIGLIAYGVVHLLIGWLALQIAWGLGSQRSADTTGAFTTLAGNSVGRVALWLIAVGLVALALWQAGQAIWGYRNRTGTKRLRKRITSGVKAVLYAALGVSAALISLGSGSSGSQSPQTTTSGVLAWPGGQAIVVVAGLVVIGVGVAGIVKGVRKSFREEIDPSEMSRATRHAVTRLGQVGYIAKGIALAVVGGLLGYAALTFDPTKAQGLDGALQTILREPYGQFMLTAIALGFGAFGLFAILQSRYRQM